MEILQGWGKTVPSAGLCSEQQKQNPAVFDGHVKAVKQIKILAFRLYNFDCIKISKIFKDLNILCKSFCVNIYKNMS